MSLAASNDQRPLSALLSQVLVVFTVEFDNEFERRMGEAGYPGARLSLVVWTNVMRFLVQGAVSVRDLAAQALAPDKHIKLALGCLERWTFVKLADEKREGWGSGQGIRADSMVRLTTKGLAAAAIWPSLFAEIEQRWEKRFGKAEISRLRRALQYLVDQLEVELPHGLPAGLEGNDAFPSRVTPSKRRLTLPTLLSQLLLTFRLEFDHESHLPLPWCANTLRVLGETPIRAADIPRLTGGSPETSDIGWQIKPYVFVTPDPSASRGKVVRLSPRGIRAQQTYHRLIREIEKRWEERFGKEEITQLRTLLRELFHQRNADASLLSQGLVPPKGTARAGHQVPALGRRAIGTAARQRMRDLVAQTELFIRDPAGALPHYPAWDFNRGFGP